MDGGSRAWGAARQRPLHTSRTAPDEGDLGVANGGRSGTAVTGVAAVEANDDGGVSKSSRGRRFLNQRER